jgi:hypothetical protein
MCCVDVMYVGSEGRETVGVLPHPLVARVKEMSTVLMDFDARLGVGCAVRISPDVRPTVDDEHPATTLGHLLSHSQSEEARSDNDEISIHATKSVP